MQVADFIVWAAELQPPVAIYDTGSLSFPTRRAGPSTRVSALCQIIVDAQGNPQNPRVVRTLGMGLDEKAIEAVMKYKFKPAMKDGKTPVAVAYYD